MFNKILSNIAINPSALNQLSFYANRLKKEQAIRRIGLAFIVLSMLVQSVAAMFPAEQSLAASSNDIISGGVSGKADLVNKCNNNVQNVKNIFAKFGITCAIINSTAQATTVNSSAYNFWSMGRTPLSNNGINSADWGERVLNVGGSNIYHRPLKAWGANVNYQAFLIKANGKNYWILKNCANLVTIGPEGPTPSLEVHKQLKSAEIVKPGDEVHFRLIYRNPVPESVAVDFRLRDMFDNQHMDLVGMTGQTGTQDGDPKIEMKGLPYDNYRTADVVGRVKANVPDGTRICNTANASADVVGVKTSNQVCVTVKVPVQPTPNPTPQQPTPEPNCPLNPNLKANDPRCVACPTNSGIWAEDPNCGGSGSCIATTAFIGKSNRDITVTTQAQVSGAYKVQSYSYDLGADGKIEATNNSSALKDTYDFKGLSLGTHKINVSVKFANGSESIVKTCQTEVDISEAKIVLSKTVVNEKGQDMNGKKVSSGDTLVFKLSTKNVEKADSAQFTGEDYFGDVLEYADIADMNQLKSQGIELDNNKNLKWTLASVKGNSEDIKTITVKVKQIVPSTNKPSSTGTDMDCVISNKYGNQVSVGVNCPLVKSIEVTTTSLPNTGPGTTVAIAFAVTLIAGYFFARSRLLAKEATIVRNIYQQTI